jgi:4-amino-4-deoxy-L-arabinose transferase-like glycosyltransferase
LLYASSVLFPQTAGSLLLASAVYVLIRFPGDARAVPIAGVALGLLALTIPAFLLVFPIFVAYLVLVHRDSAKRAVGATVLLLATTSLVILPWTIRNYVQFGELVPVSTNSGINFLKGNSENATPDSGVNVDISSYLAASEGMTEPERDAYLRSRAVDWIAHNPSSALKLYVMKLVNHFNFRNQLASRGESSSLRAIVMMVTYYPLLAVAALRLGLFRRYPLDRAELLLLGLYLGNAFVSSIFFTRIRFRLPFDMLLIGAVATFIASVVYSRKGWDVRSD